MGKEKQCECCHEWWFDSDIKNDLCPNCYDYFRQLKQQLEEKNKLIELLNRKVDRYENMFRSRTMKRTGDMQKDIEIYIKQLAIQELEKVKCKIEKRNNGTSNANYSTQYKDGYSSCCCDIEEQITQQIKELKGE